MVRTLVACSFLVFIVGVFLPEHTSNLIGTLIGSFLFYNNKYEKTNTNVLTSKELELYNGIDKPELYLSILGNIFDVTRSKKHYGPQQQYNVFVGCDASRSFVTGKFNKREISEEVSDLSHEELRSLNHWVKFYKKEYLQVGKLIGKYYNKDGKLTPYGSEVKKLIKAAELDKKNEKEDLKKFPPCNVEWNAEQGTRIWCTTKSGGVLRDWEGVPRQYYEAKSKHHRCACIKEDQLEDIGNIKEYEGCEKSSNVCYVKT